MDINTLVQGFARHIRELKAPDYKESRARQEYIDPFWKLLGLTMVNYLSWVILTVCGTRVFFNFDPFMKLDGLTLWAAGVRARSSPEGSFCAPSSAFSGSNSASTLPKRILSPGFSACSI